MRPQALGARQPLRDHVRRVEGNRSRASPIARPPAMVKDDEMQAASGQYEVDE